jgi:hypothetical protein
MYSVFHDGFDEASETNQGMSIPITLDPKAQGYLGTGELLDALRRPIVSVYLPVMTNALKSRAGKLSSRVAAAG